MISSPNITFFVTEKQAHCISRPAPNLLDRDIWRSQYNPRGKIIICALFSVLIHSSWLMRTVRRQNEMVKNNILCLYPTNFDIIDPPNPLMNCNIYPRVCSPIVAIIYLDFYVYYLILISQFHQVRCYMGFRVLEGQ